MKKRKQYTIYFQYLQNIYNVKQIDSGIMFKPKEEALKDYYNNGGHFTDEELEKLDFSKIGK